MEFTGRIYKLLPLRKGTRPDGTEWQSQEFIFEYFENENDRWSDKVVLSVMNERIAEYDLHVGDEVRIGFGHSIDDYQDRCYNKLRMYKFEKVKTMPATETPATTPQPATEQTDQTEKDGDLPF